jgi:hypothetical protein
LERVIFSRGIVNLLGEESSARVGSSVSRP